MYTLHSGVPDQKHTSNEFQPIDLAADKISAGSGKKSESWTRMRRKWWQWRTAGRHLKVGRSWNCWFPRISLRSVWISLCTEHSGSLFFFFAIERWRCFQDKCIHFWLNLRPYTGFWFNHNCFEPSIKEDGRSQSHAWRGPNPPIPRHQSGFVIMS